MFQSMCVGVGVCASGGCMMCVCVTEAVTSTVLCRPARNLSPPGLRGGIRRGDNKEQNTNRGRSFVSAPVASTQSVRAEMKF